MRILSKRQLKELVLYSPQHIARLEKAGQFPKRVTDGVDGAAKLSQTNIYTWADGTQEVRYFDGTFRDDRIWISNRDAAQGEDTRFHKQPPCLKPLDQAPYAAFDISFDRSSYLYITLGVIDTDARAGVLDPAGKPIAGLCTAGVCAAHIPRNGKQYASRLSLGPGSFFGRIAGREAAASCRAAQ